VGEDDEDCIERWTPGEQYSFESSLRDSSMRCDSPTAVSVDGGRLSDGGRISLGMLDLTDQSCSDLEAVEHREHRMASTPPRPPKFKEGRMSDPVLSPFAEVKAPAPVLCRCSIAADPNAASA